jgi:hypothetical protein
MGCKCSKEEELGDLEVSEYEENYEEDQNNNIEANNYEENNYNNTITNQNNNIGNTNANINEIDDQERELDSNKQFTFQKTGFFKADVNNPQVEEATKNCKNNNKNQIKTLKHPIKNDINTLDSTDLNNFPSMNNYDQSFTNKKKKKLKTTSNDEYNKEVLRLFSLARNKSLSYCKHIDYCITLITTNAEGQLVIGTEKTNKIGLKEGISKFNECKRFLLQIESCSELKYDKDLEIDISDDAELWLNNEYIKNKIIEKQLLFSNESSDEIKEKDKKKKDYNIFGFHFDFGMHDPIISSVLQLVDDNNCENRRRYNIMNSEYKAVGITNKVQGKKFVSYFFFAG